MHRLCAPVGSRGLVVRLVDLAAGDDVVLATAALLSPAEARRAAVGTPPVRRRRVLLRAALRELLADELDVPPRRVTPR